ncbi:MAG: hypothetical protein AAFX96_10305, partial [Pseudomonadota bacterium]
MDDQKNAQRPGEKGTATRFETAKVVLEQIRPFYSKANIPMVSDRRACEKVVALVDDNNKLRRIPKERRSTELVIKQLAVMECRLDASFPLWVANAEKMMTDSEDIAFLVNMKNDRTATFGPFDAKLDAKVKRREDREYRAAAWKDRAVKEQQGLTKTVSSDILTDHNSDVDEMPGAPFKNADEILPTKRKKTGTVAFIPPDILSRPSLVSLATRLKISPTQQAAFTRGLIEESGGDVSSVSASYATADRSRRKILKESSVKKHEEWIPPPLCTLHWDGKLTPTLNDSRRLEERLTVVVGDNKNHKLLGVP